MGLQFTKLLCLIGQEGGGEGGLRTISSKIICSRSSSITFYRSLVMPNQAERQKERSQGTSIQQTSMPYWPSWGGGLRTIGWKIICSKSNSITFYTSLRMRNQVERTKGTVARDFNSTNVYALLAKWPKWGGGEGGAGGSENNRFADYLLQIQFYHVL